MSVRAWGRRGALGILFVALALAMIRPHFGRFPSDPADPSFVAWTMAWVGHAVVHAPAHILDANIFWPRGAAYAYSDLLVPVAPVYLGFHALTGSWELAVTLTSLTLVVFALATGYTLARWLTGRSDVAVFGAIAFALNGYVLAQISHLQLYSLGFIALSFLLLFRLLEAPATGRAIGFGVSLAVTLYAALYYGLITAATATLAVVVWLVVTRRSRPAGTGRALVIAAFVAALLIAPAGAAYLRAQHITNYHRAIDPPWGLRARDLVTPPAGSYVWRALSHRSIPADAEHRLFAGFTTYALAAFGLLALAIRRRQRERFTLLLAAGGTLTLLLALGPVVGGRKMLFWYFHDAVPGFGAVRAVARFAVVTLLALAMLAAVGLERLTNGLRPRRRTITVTVLCGLLLAEFAAPLRWQGLRHDRATLAVYHRLATEPPGAVADLPMASHRSPPGTWALTESPRMLFSTIDWHPRVNGYAGLTPKGYARDTALINTFPSDAALARLRGLRVRYVVWHPSGSPLARPLPPLPPSLPAERVGRAWLIRIPAP